MICYQDNICIGATNEKELKKKTDIVLNRLRNTGMIINEKKCVNNNSKISLLEYTISKEGISPDQTLIEKNTKNSYMAIVWTTTRAQQFLIGKTFLLRSDHRPLEFIFNPRKELPKVMTSTLRILRWTIRLMAFDFDIEYVKGNSIPRVDILSRLQFNKELKDKTEEEYDDTFLYGLETDVLS